MVSDIARRLAWHVPDWLPRELDLSVRVPDDESKMRVALEVCRKNVAHGGGPFGALIVDGASSSIVSVGANWVVEQRSSLLHAEVAAIAFAQTRLGTHCLDGAAYELVTTSEPCTQCLGATVWSGVRRLLCAATIADAEAVGFDEGPLRDDWPAELERRGIRVTRELLRTEARGILETYRAQGGPIYGPSRRP